jgi:hypothetical protein
MSFQNNAIKKSKIKRALNRMVEEISNEVAATQLLKKLDKPYVFFVVI